MKRTIKLTESKLKKIITESVKTVLRESHWDKEMEYTWDELMQMFGAEEFVWAVYRILPSDDTDYLITEFKRDIDADGNESYEEETEGYSADEYWEDFCNMWGAEEFSWNIYRSLDGKVIEDIIETLQNYD